LTKEQPNVALADKNVSNVAYLKAKLKDEYGKQNSNPRLRMVLVIFFVFLIVIIFRLVLLMLWQHNFYLALSSGSREFYSQLYPKRGSILFQDSRTKEEFPLALNKDYFLLYADTREIKDNQTAEQVVQKLTEIFNYNDEKKVTVLAQLNKRTDPYEPLEKKIAESVYEKIKSLNLPGVNFVRLAYRYYPEGELGAPIIGFLGKDKDDNNIGSYGVEGYWQNELAGKGGFMTGSKTAVGSLAHLANWSFNKAEDGADILLTIDRTLEFKACNTLKKAQEEYGAVSASLIMLEPSTGAIRAMCSFPSFDPNDYGQVTSANVYNNNTIFAPYEPGSVFKPLVMAVAINEGVVKPETTFVDTGSREGFCQTPIKNAMGRSYGLQNMSGVLENSINTGMVFVVEKLGKNKLIDYIKNFGFGTKEGIELDTEVSGKIDTLNQKKGDKIDCYAATASFGQGITATPLQLVTAFGAIANGGQLMKPYIIDEMRFADGHIEKTKPQEVREVITNRSSLLTRSLMVNVIDKGHSTLAAVKGYYVGGKTGTAQIPGPGGYTEETIHTFVGLAPIDNPKFVLLVKFEKPQRLWADGTAAPIFGEIAKFALQYYQIPPSR